MKKLQAQINKRLVAAMLVTVAVIGLSALAMHAPTQNQNSHGSFLEEYSNRQGDTVLCGPEDGSMLVRRASPARTSESKAATENLKLVAATL